jgi:hypothetical protein
MVEVQPGLVGGVRESVLLETVVAELRKVKMRWEGWVRKSGRRTSGLSCDGLALRPKSLHVLICHLSCLLYMTMLLALADLSVALWDTLHGA